MPRASPLALWIASTRVPSTACSTASAILRDWLRAHPADRDRYAAAKHAAADAARAHREHVMQHDARKEAVIRAVYARAFAAAGLIP